MIDYSLWVKVENCRGNYLGWECLKKYHVQTVDMARLGELSWFSKRENEEVQRMW